MNSLIAADVFTTGHIAVTAVISGGAALLAALLINGRSQSGVADSVAIGVLTAAAVFLWRKSANLPQLNTDGLSGFSANDWLAPALTYIGLGLYRYLRTPHDANRYGKALAAATIISFAVNVVTI
jgi:hypothetical protein